MVRIVIVGNIIVANVTVDMEFLVGIMMKEGLFGSLVVVFIGVNHTIAWIGVIHKVLAFGL